MIIMMMVVMMMIIMMIVVMMMIVVVVVVMINMMPFICHSAFVSKMAYLKCVVLMAH